MSSSSSSSLSAAESAPRDSGGSLRLALTSLGVVYGDIGTSPLYAIRECFFGEHSVPVTDANVLGVLSLVFWALALVVSGKYLLYVLRADNHGEGGILALVALASSQLRPASRTAFVVTMLGLFGAALLYGDGVITPAISVLSAVEGLALVAPGFASYVVPIAVGILLLLFSVQGRGTGRIGSVFGPVVMVWFLSIAVAGLPNIAATPTVLRAINPLYGIEFLISGGRAAFLVLGAVFLVVTGAEALYADMGHVGRSSIRLTWFPLVKPALLLNYFGQGAYLLSHPEAAQSPFYLMLPTWAIAPMVALATGATVIASQALISGVFSLTRQASMLGFWPRIRVMHTSGEHMGQVYVPSANWMLLVGTIGAVLFFQSSTRLAAAYGVAVTSTMLITTMLATLVARRMWGWSLLAVLLTTIAFLVPDVAFFFANIAKLQQGGWFPIGFALAVMLLMSTWKRGRALLAARMHEALVTVEELQDVMRIERPARVPGCAVFMTSSSVGVPLSLIRNFEHNRVVHSVNVLLTVTTEERPYVNAAERLQVEDMADGFVRVTARYGFMEHPDVPDILKKANIAGFEPGHTTYFFGREIVMAEDRGGMARWRKRLFGVMARNSQRATAFFNIPAEQVIEISSHVRL